MDPIIETRFENLITTLWDMAKEQSSHELAMLAVDATKLKSDVANTKPKRERRARRMTQALADEIRRYRAANPQITAAAIAEHFGVNNGRVSEALNGEKWV